MNWARNNRFLAGYLTVLIIGLGVLGFLVFSSYGHYSQVSDDYDTQVRELKRLQNLPPYPDANNLKSYDQVKQDYAKAVFDLQKKLASYEPAPENPPPTALKFQDRLRGVVDEVSKFAAQSGVALPENFYLGFEQYRGAPPDAAVTPALSAELDAIRDLVDILIKAHVTSISAVKRGLLPREGGASIAAGADLSRSGRPGAAAPTTAELVTREPLEVDFICLPSPLRESLDAITSASRLYVIEALQVKNEVDKGPERGAEQIIGGPGASGEPNRRTPQGPPGPPRPPGPPQLDQNGVPVQPLPEKGPPPLRYVVGLEKVIVAARINLVKVAPPR